MFCVSVSCLVPHFSYLRFDSVSYPFPSRIRFNSFSFNYRLVSLVSPDPSLLSRLVSIVSWSLSLSLGLIFSSQSLLPGPLLSYYPGSSIRLRLVISIPAPAHRSNLALPPLPLPGPPHTSRVATGLTNTGSPGPHCQGTFFSFLISSFYATTTFTLTAPGHL